MRTLNLKGMSWIMALAMMFIVSFTSCSDDKEEGATTPVFPEEQAISCNTGETKVLTFDANMTWQLRSATEIGYGRRNESDCHRNTFCQRIFTENIRC